MSSKNINCMLKITKVLIVVFASAISYTSAQNIDSLKEKYLTQANQFIGNIGGANTNSTSQDVITRNFISSQSSDELKRNINTFQNQLKQNPTSANLHFKIGMCYYFSFDEQKKALPYFIAASKKISKDYDVNNSAELNAPFVSLYFLAQTFLELNKPDSALKYFSLYQSKYTNSPLNADREMLICNNAMNAEKNIRDVTVNKLTTKINSVEAEINPVVQANGSRIFFASNRNRSDAKQKSFDIYYSNKNADGTWSDAKAMSINTDDDEMPSHLSSDGTVLYFVKNSDKNSDIFYTTYNAGVWEQPKPFREINTSANESGVSITADGKTLYVSSDRDNNANKFEIFLYTKDEKGKWGDAENISNPVNTSFNELNPFISPNGQTLYFISNGFANKCLGGYDIYYSNLLSDNTFSEPQNMQYPVNKNRNEQSICAAGNSRYYSTLSEDASYDIFEITTGSEENIASANMEVVSVTKEMDVTNVLETDKIVEKETIVKEAIETEVVKEKEVEIQTAVEVEKIVEKEVEVIKPMELEKEKEVALNVAVETPMEKELNSKSGKKSDKKPKDKTEKKHADPMNFSTLNMEELEVNNRNVLISKVRQFLDKPLIENAPDKYLTINFGFNRTTISKSAKKELLSLVKYLSENPTYKIEIIGHADKKGNFAGNVEVANKRSQKVFDYLLQHHITKDKMFNYGKSNISPVTNEDNDEAAMQNRRVDIYILKSK
jgi:outer membrane protein OmpA-like peptidoglycan-associated protein